MKRWRAFSEQTAVNKPGRTGSLWRERGSGQWVVVERCGLGALEAARASSHVLEECAAKPIWARMKPRHENCVKARRA